MKLNPDCKETLDFFRFLLQQTMNLRFGIFLSRKCYQMTNFSVFFILGLMDCQKIIIPLVVFFSMLSVAAAVTVILIEQLK